MKRLAFVLLCIFLPMFSFGQEDTYLHFFGYVAHKDSLGRVQPVPYTLVSFSKRATPDVVVASTLSGSCGEISYNGVPIDLNVDYIFTVYGDADKPEVFLSKACPDCRKRYEKGSNISCNMYLSHSGARYVSESCLKYKNKETSTILDLLKLIPGLEMENGEIYCKKSGGSVQIQLNGRADRGGTVAEMLEGFAQIPLSLCDDIFYVELNKPTGIYDAVLDLRIRDSHRVFPEFMREGKYGLDVYGGSTTK